MFDVHYVPRSPTRIFKRRAEKYFRGNEKSRWSKRKITGMVYITSKVVEVIKNRLDLHLYYFVTNEKMFVLSLIEDLKTFLEPLILINYLYSLVCVVSAIFFVIEVTVTVIY